MAKQAETTKQIQCPSCGNKAKRVSTTTLAALLHDEYAAQFKTDGQSCCASEGEGCTSIKADTGWRFCESKNCDVVYFSEEGDTSFTKSQLRVAVGVKEEAGPRPLCYCFGHSVASIKEELVATGTSNAQDDIRAKMKAPGCRCETENRPQAFAPCKNRVTHRPVNRCGKDVGARQETVEGSINLPLLRL